MPLDVWLNLVFICVFCGQSTFPLFPRLSAPFTTRHFSLASRPVWRYRIAPCFLNHGAQRAGLDMATKKLNFEKALAELEKLVEEMEQGELSMEDMLKRFEKGIALTTECQQALQKAELKVKELVDKNGKLLEKDFELDN